MQEEIWKDIPGYEQLYKASTFGNIKSLAKSFSKFFKNRGWELYHTKDKVMKLGLQTTGYLTITLCKNGKQTSHSVHRLVAETFLVNPNNYPVINHKNTIRHDNRVENLEWCTYSKNNSLPFLQGRRPIIRGSENILSKLDETQVLTIKSLLVEGKISKRQIADYFKISVGTVNSIKAKRTWGHLEFSSHKTLIR